MFDLEKSIQKWLSNFRKHRGFEEGSFQEMEQHIRDHVDDLVAQGYTEQKAFDTASQSFGEIPEVGKEVLSTRLRSWTLGSFISRAIFRNYVKTSSRSLTRNPLSSLVNILGLSAAIGICVLGYAFNRYVTNVDQFHENKDQLYLTTFWANRDGELQQYGQAPAPIGGILDQSDEQGVDVCRIKNHNVVVKRDALVFHERVRMVDPSFLEFFTFPMKWSTGTLLDDPNSIVLSEHMATKYFGDQNPLGERLQLIFGKNHKRTFQVTGVAKSFPAAKSFDFDFLLHLDVMSFADPNIRLTNWSERLDATFIRMSGGEKDQLVLAELEKLRLVNNEVDDQWQIESFALEPMSTLYQKTDDIRGDIAGRGFRNLYYSSISFVIIGLLVLVLAASNYINIAIVSAVKRLKEIGLRKVIGASRGAVLIQFLAENLILMSIATVIGFVLGGQVFVPWLERTMSFQMEFDWLDPKLLIFLPSILLFTALISGTYPAIHVSRIQVATIFKGASKIGQKSILTRVFVGFQLFVTFLLISMAVMFTQNAKYQQQRSWGYEQEGILFVEVPDKQSFDQMTHAITQHPKVQLASGAQHHLGKSSQSYEIQYEGQPYEVQDLAVASDYFETMQLQITQGRSFLKNQENNNRSVVINQTMADRLGMDNPIGKWIKKDSASLHIVGLVQDFHSYSFYVPVSPTIFTVAQPGDYRFLALRTDVKGQKEVYEMLEKQWSSLFPEIPFDGGYQEDVWGNFHQSMNDGSNFWKALAGVVTLIASLGLYGLLTLNVAGRSREFSIRKVLGARLGNIVGILSSQYWSIYIITVALATPVSYHLIKVIFNLFYAYHMPLSYTFMWYSGSILLLVLGIIIALELRRLMVSNPVDGLKVE